MLAKDVRSPRSKRHLVLLQGQLAPDDRRATIISFSAVGCAFRTTVRLERGSVVTLALNVGKHKLRISGEVVWAAEDFRIDTFYSYGIRFFEPLDDQQLALVLDEERGLSTRDGSLIRANLQ